SQSVKVCIGADLQVSKTATPSFTRTYKWTIGKDVDKTLVKQVGGTATFNYTVKASETGFTDSLWQANGSIRVTNHNDWEAITVTDTFNGVTTTLGTLTATDGAPFTASTYLYSHTVTMPAIDCLTYTNTAKIVETGQSASQTVKVCGPAKTGALTIGFWQNKN